MAEHVLIWPTGLLESSLKTIFSYDHTTYKYEPIAIFIYAT